MSLPIISVAEARKLIDQGAVLVDVREADEHARERIPGARHAALSSLDGMIAAGGAPAVIFHCRSGSRTQANAPRLAAAAEVDAYVLEGGLEAWKKSGHDVLRDRGRPIEVMRQVQIAAGSLVVLGVLLGAFVAPEFLGLAGFVGAGLVLAGVTGWCGMATLLQAMPWNRAAAPARP